MSEALEIKYSVSGADKAASDHIKVAAASEKQAKAQEKAARVPQGPYQRLGNLQSAAATVAPGSAAGKDVAAAIEATQKRIARIEVVSAQSRPSITGPYQRLSDLRAGAASLDSASDAGKDAAAAIARTERQIERIESKNQPGQTPPNFMQRLGETLSRSRIGAGGVMPLVGDVAKLLGPEAAAAAVAAEGLFKVGKFAFDTAEAFGRAAQQIADSSNRFQQYSLTTGGSGETTGTLKSLGIDAGLARSFNARMNSDPFAQATATRAGLYNAPEPFGNVDEGKQLQAAVMYLRSIDNKQERIRQARMLGLEELLPQTNMTNIGMGGAMLSGGASAIANTDEMGRVSADFTQATRNFNTNLETAGTLAGQLFLPLATRGLQLLNTIGDVDLAMAGLAERFHLTPLLDLLGFGASKSGGSNKDLQNNTGAMQELSRQLAVGMPGVYGNGERAGRVMPGGMMGGVAGQKAMEAGGYQMGWF